MLMGNWKAETRRVLSGRGWKRAGGESGVALGGDLQRPHSCMPPAAPLRAGALGGLASQHPAEHVLNPVSGRRRRFASDPLCSFEQAAFSFLQLLVIYQFFEGRSLGGVCAAPGWMGPRSLTKPLLQ